MRWEIDERSGARRASRLYAIIGSGITVDICGRRALKAFQRGLSIFFGFNCAIRLRDQVNFSVWRQPLC